MIWVVLRLFLRRYPAALICFAGLGPPSSIEGARGLPIRPSRLLSTLRASFGGLGLKFVNGGGGRSARAAPASQCGAKARRHILLRGGRAFRSLLARAHKLLGWCRPHLCGAWSLEAVVINMRSLATRMHNDMYSSYVSPAMQKRNIGPSWP